MKPVCNLPPLMRRALRRASSETATQTFSALGGLHKRRPPKRKPTLRDYSKPAKEPER